MTGAQLTLDDIPQLSLRQPARNTDPETSHEAARKLQTSGKLTEQCVQTLTALVRYEFGNTTAPTSYELAGTDLQLRYLYARRLPDLEHKGLVIRLDSKRPCTISGSAAFPWRVTEEGMTMFRALRAERKATTTQTEGGSSVQTR